MRDDYAVDDYVALDPRPDRTPAPAGDVAAFMALHLFTCQLLAARITARQCELNRASGHVSCVVCIQPRMQATPLPKKVKRRKGENDGVFKRRIARTDRSDWTDVVQVEPEPCRPVPAKAAEGRGQRAEGRGQRAEGRGGPAGA